MWQHARKAFVLPLVAALSFGVGLGFAELTSLSRVSAQSTPARTLHQLNEDFIGISERVTPAVVSIAMSRKARRVSPQQMDPNAMPDDFFDFFGVPNPQQMPDGEPQQGVGSGVIVDAAKGYVLTNNHVVDGADEIRVTLTDRRSFKAKVVGTDSRSDLAVIQIEGATDLKQVTLGDASSLKVGEWVLAIGNPFGLDSTVTAGIISAKGRANVGVAEFEDFIQTDAAINPGNSGGALVNIQGELIGINTAIATRSRGYMGIGFAIPSNMAREVMQSLIAKGKVSRSQLGVYIQQIDESMAQSLGLENARQGILVSGVSPGSPAEKAGIQKYDVITRLNGQSVSDANQFRNRIALTAPGSQVKLDILRNGQPLNFAITLAEASSQTSNQAPPIAPGANGNQDVRVEDLTSRLRQQFELPAGATGVVVSDVVAGSAAYEKGLRPGDLITELNRQPVRSATDFNRSYQAIKSGQSVLLSVNRQGAAILLAWRKP
ncbi:MAG: DegQ family serine endoprotease [Candidatus Sericytochromatia bacterium]